MEHGGPHHLSVIFEFVMLVPSCNWRWHPGFSSISTCTFHWRLLFSHLYESIVHWLLQCLVAEIINWICDAFFFLAIDTHSHCQSTTLVLPPQVLILHLHKLVYLKTYWHEWRCCQGCHPFLMAIPLQCEQSCESQSWLPWRSCQCIWECPMMLPFSPEPITFGFVWWSFHFSLAVFSTRLLYRMMIVQSCISCLPTLLSVFFIKSFPYLSNWSRKHSFHTLQQTKNHYQQYLMLWSCVMLCLKLLIKHTPELLHLSAIMPSSFINALCGINNFKRNNLPGFKVLLDCFLIVWQTFIVCVASKLPTVLNKDLGLEWEKDNALVQPAPPLPMMDAKDAHDAFRPLAKCLCKHCSVIFLHVQLGFSSPSVGKPTSPPDVREVIAKLDNYEGWLIGGFGEILSPDFCHL